MQLLREISRSKACEGGAPNMPLLVRCRRREAFFREIEGIGGFPLLKTAVTARHGHEEPDFLPATAPPSLGRTVGHYLASPPPPRSQFSHCDNYDAFRNALSAHDYSYRDMTCQSTGACTEAAASASERRFSGPTGEREQPLLTLAESLDAVGGLHLVPRGRGERASIGDGVLRAREAEQGQEQGTPEQQPDSFPFHACVRSIAQEVMAEPVSQPLFSLMPAVLHHSLLSSEANLVCGCGCVC